MSLSSQQTIGFIGTGQMSRALATGLISGGIVDPTQLIGADPIEQARTAFESTTGATTTDSNKRVVETSDVVFLAVKPQHLKSVAAQLSAVPGRDVLFVSILAGVRLHELSQHLGTERIIRVMPNTPCLVSKGASAFCLGPAAAEADASLVQQMLESVGVARQLSEPLMDAVTGLSGSGPAYAFQIIEGLSDGGVLMGLPRETATLLAAQTLLGAAAMVLETGEHPAALKDRVTSPGGTTIAGIHALESGGLRSALMDAVRAATIRSQELGNRN